MHISVGVNRSRNVKLLFECWNIRVEKENESPSYLELCGFMLTISFFVREREELSAVCVFSLSDINKVMDGPFKELKKTCENWINPEPIPSPRPGQVLNRVIPWLLNVHLIIVLKGWALFTKSTLGTIIVKFYWLLWSLLFILIWPHQVFIF